MESRKEGGRPSGEAGQKTVYQERIRRQEKVLKNTVTRGKRPPRMGEHSRAPTMLEVGAGPTKRSIQDPGELAEQIRKPFEEKGRVVKAAIGQPRGDYMAKVRTLHEGNVGKFHKGPISVEDSKQKTTRGSKQAQLWRG